MSRNIVMKKLVAPIAIDKPIYANANAQQHHRHHYLEVVNWEEI